RGVDDTNEPSGAPPVAAIVEARTRSVSRSKTYQVVSDPHRASSALGSWGETPDRSIAAPSSAAFAHRKIAVAATAIRDARRSGIRAGHRIATHTRQIAISHGSAIAT